MVTGSVSLKIHGLAQVDNHQHAIFLYLKRTRDFAYSKITATLPRNDNLSFG